MDKDALKKALDALIQDASMDDVLSVLVGITIDRSIEAIERDGSPAVALKWTHITIALAQAHLRAADAEL